MASYIYKDVELIDKKILRTALTKIHGIGYARSSYLCNLLGLAPYVRTEMLNPYFFFR